MKLLAASITLAMAMPGMAESAGGEGHKPKSASEPQEVLVTEERLETEDIDRLPAIQGTVIFAGKKSEVINLASFDANLVRKNPREIFAKVPGVFVYDMDGAGNQVNIATRGLDPHRGWEFNIRMDGFTTQLGHVRLSGESL